MPLPPKVSLREAKVLNAYYIYGGRLVDTLSELSGESKTFVRKTIYKFKLENTI